VLGRPHLDYHLVAVSSGVLAVGKGIPEGMVSLVVGLIGVALARWVFVNKQYRETARPQRWGETIPLTLVAMLVAGVLIWDRKFSVSTSAFVGLGVGWTAVLLLDILGDWILTKAKAMFSAGPADPKFPKRADLSGQDGKMLSSDVDLPGDFKDAVDKLNKK
jgi:F0F1-type ATP synthase assembly protein I